MLLLPGCPGCCIGQLHEVFCWSMCWRTAGEPYISQMVTADAGGSQRVIAIHPGCPLALRHDGAWKLQSYKTEADVSSSADVQCKTARCSRCGTPVLMLTFDMVRKLILKVYNSCVSHGGSLRCFALSRASCLLRTWTPSRSLS